MPLRSTYKKSGLFFMEFIKRNTVKNVNKITCPVLQTNKQPK
jgi:hypothetical protein